MRRFIIGVAAALALCGCSLLGNVTGSDPQNLAKAEQGLTLAHLAYQGLGDGLKSAATAGLLKGSAAHDAQVFYDKAGAVLDAGNTADSLANAQGINDAVAQANSLILQSKAIISPKKVTP